MRGYRRRNPPRLSRATLILILYGALSLVAVGIGAWRGDLDLYRVDGKSTATWLALSPALGIAVGLGVVLFSRFSVKHWQWARQLHTDFRDLLGQLGTGEIAILAVASSVGEELLFRGALQPMVGVWLQAVIFAMLHVGPGIRFLPWTISALVIGLLFGWMVELTGDLGAPIACHFVINFMNLRYIARVELDVPKPEQETEPEPLDAADPEPATPV